MKPILFNTEMVKAILEDRKTATRRLIKPQPVSHLAYTCMGCGTSKWRYPSRDAHKYWDDPSFAVPDDISDEEYSRAWTPPCNTGDILYVREAWAYSKLVVGGIIFRAGCPGLLAQKFRWRPSIHMPKTAARIFLRVKRVSVERLRDIDDAGVVAEGLNIGDPFDELWDSTIKKADLDKYGWDANPWVWVIEFERCEKPQEV